MDSCSRVCLALKLSMPTEQESPYYLTYIIGKSLADHPGVDCAQYIIRGLNCGSLTGIDKD